VRPFLENLQKNDVPCAVGCSAAAVLVEEALDALDLSQFFQVGLPRVASLLHLPPMRPFTPTRKTRVDEPELFMWVWPNTQHPCRLTAPSSLKRRDDASIAPGMRTRWWVVGLYGTAVFVCVSPEISRGGARVAGGDHCGRRGARPPGPRSVHVRRAGERLVKPPATLDHIGRHGMG